MASALLTRTHRRDLRVLTGQAERDLRVLWRDFSSPVAARDMLSRTLPDIVTAYGSAAGTLGADYYDEMRDAAKARGRFRASPAKPAEGEPLDILARVAIGPLFGAAPDLAASLTLATGGLQRHIANVDRETVVAATVEDRAARWWVRVGNGGCDWCAQYLDGEARSVAYDFPAHDHCQCTAEPDFS